MSDRDKINSRPRRAIKAHRGSRKIEIKANMEAFEREHREYKKKKCRVRKMKLERIGKRTKGLE